METYFLCGVGFNCCSIICSYIIQILKINENLQRQKDELELLTDQKNKGNLLHVYVYMYIGINLICSLLIHCLEFEKQVEKLKQKSAQTYQLNEKLVVKMQHLMSLQQEKHVVSQTHTTTKE